jgi:hypothetical protein
MIRLKVGVDLNGFDSRILLAGFAEFRCILRVFKASGSFGDCVFFEGFFV